MISGLRLFSKRHSTASKALASAFDRRHPVRPKYGTRPLGLSCVIRPGLSRQRAAPSRERFREIAAFAFNGDLQRNTSRDMGHIDIQCRNAINPHILGVRLMLVGLSQFQVLACRSAQVLRGLQLCLTKNQAMQTCGCPALESADFNSVPIRTCKTQSI